MLKSNSSVIKNILIIDLNIEDFFIDNYGLLFSQLLNEKNLTKVIFNLEDLDVITSDDIQKIERLIKLLNLSGVSSIVCNINPYSASLLFSFVEEINFKTALNIESAINEFSYQ